MANYCSQCGRKLSGSENFCPDCGSKIDKSRQSISTKDVSELLKEAEPIKEIYENIKDDIQDMYIDIPDDTDNCDFNTIGGIENSRNISRSSVQPKMKTINPRRTSSDDERVIGIGLILLGIIIIAGVIMAQIAK